MVKKESIHCTVQCKNSTRVGLVCKYQYLLFLCQQAEKHILQII